MVQLVNTVKLYKERIRIQLVQTNKGVRNNNMPLDDNDYRIFKGVTNEVEFQVRDNDRRAINLIGKRLIATVMNHETGERVFQRVLEVIDSRKGKALLTINPNDVINLLPGFYRYSVMIENEDGTQNILFMDKNQLGIGFLELIDGNLPPITESIELDPQKDFHPSGQIFEITDDKPNTFLSSALPGSSHLGLTSGLHTFAVFSERFKGKLIVLGTLMEKPSSDVVPPNTDWFRINVEATGPEIRFDRFTGVDAFNFYMNVSWIRFMFIPDTFNDGKLTKIQYIP